MILIAEYRSHSIININSSHPTIKAELAVIGIVVVKAAVVLVTNVGRNKSCSIE